MKEKKAHGVQLLIRCIVRDPDGKVIRDTGEKKAKSFVIQFLEFLYGMLNAPATVMATATDGTEQEIYDASDSPDRHMRVDGGINNDLMGIVVGTGDTAETNTDYALDTQIEDGTGAGQLVHGSCTIGAVAVVGANVDMQVTRTFTNGSGDTITVTEAGIYARQAYSAWKYHCLIRDVLPAGIDVPNLCSISIIYTLRTTV